MKLDDRALLWIITVTVMLLFVSQLFVRRSVGGSFSVALPKFEKIS